jgi:hypothetical protein
LEITIGAVFRGEKIDLASRIAAQTRQKTAVGFPMAKAQFLKHQRVWVEAVGAWAVVERIVPVWAKGFDEPVRITYDVGLGREFLAAELTAEAPLQQVDPSDGPWRVLRGRNKWQSPEDCGHHPYPGTFPVVVTDPNDWGGWRLPGAEYDRDPRKFEAQARLIASAPKLMQIAKALAAFVADSADDAPPELLDLARKAASVERFVVDTPEPPPAARAAAE